MNRAWLREIISNNDRMTSVELIINKFKKVIKNLKANKSNPRLCKTCWKNWQNKEWCGYSIDCIHNPMPRIDHYKSKESMEWLDKLAKKDTHERE